MATVHYGRLLGPVGFSRTVAIKRLHPQFAQDPEFVTMFLDEARLAGRIRHPNVVATLDVVATSNEIFLVMDYVHGESLARIMRALICKDEVVPLPIALRIASDALQGLHAAHEARDERGVPLNIVHRDISPQNILVGVDGTARLVDFGVAKATGQGQTTREGQIKGKLGYMAPEQLRGGKVSRQTDIHAFATVLWEMLTGRRLFAGDNEADTVGKVVMHSIPLVADLVPGTPPAVDTVLRKGLSESLAVRYATARDMCIALDACGPAASTMQVADWVLGQVPELIERRAQVVSAIESNQEISAPHESTKAEGESAKDWVARLSAPDATEVGKPAGPAATQETGVSAVLSNRGPQEGHRSSVWVQVAVAALGIGGLLVGVLSWASRGGEPTAPAATPVSSPTASSMIAGAQAAAPPSTGIAPAVSAGRDPAPATAPPDSSSAAASAAPVVSAPAVSRPASAPRPSARGQAPPRHDSVFESRE